MRQRVAIGLCALAALLGACADDDAETTGPRDRVDVTTDADRVSVGLVTFDDEPVSLDDYRGRPLVVNLFASWCAPCISEMPAIERVKQAVGDQVAFLGVAVNDRVDDALALIDETGITWDVARDPRGEFAAAMETRGMPSTFLVSADGEIVERHTGEISEGELRSLIEEHFGVAA